MVEIIISGERLDLATDFHLDIEVENPFMTVDHIPVAHTYTMDFPISGKNKRLLNVVEGVLVLPFTEVEAEIRVCGLSLMNGKLSIDAVDMSARTISATFSNSLDWSPYQDKSLCDITELNNVDLQYQDPCNLYSLNYATRGWAILFKDILNKILPSATIDSAYNGLLERLAMAIMLYGDKDYYWYEDPEDGGQGGAGVKNLLDGFPNVAIPDFINDLCNLLCATLVVNGKEVRILSNKAIIQSTDYAEWEVDDSISGEVVPAKRYQCGYEALMFENDLKWKDYAEDEDGPEIRTVGSINALLSNNTQTTDDCVFKVSNGAYLDYYIKHRMDGSFGYSFKGIERMNPDEVESDDKEVIDARCKFVPVTPRLCQRWNFGNHDLRFQTDLDTVFPAQGDEKPTKVYIGLLAQGVTTYGSNGSYTTLLDRGYLPSGAIAMAHSLSMNSAMTYNLFSRYHFPYYGFWETTKAKFSVRPQLSTAQLQRLIAKPYEPLLIRHRKCFLDKASITISPDGVISVEADVITR